MRILALDHFFDQDLAALRTALRPGDSLTAIPYRRLHRLARRAFPARAFTGLEAAYAPEMQASWLRYEQRVERVADWLCASHAPSVFVTPSDSFFYIRPLITAFRRRDVPTVVVQKETTISPMVMAEHSLAVGRFVPFMSDAMTVCSERHRDFWVRAGTDPSRVIVTGQPRFDIYATSEAEGRRDTRPTLLYLSYDDIAYLPSDTGVAFEGTWRELRRETEIVIADVSDRWRVIVKRHPQQAAGGDWLGARVEHAPRDADTRALILGADAVVGFQTTALFEAAVARRPILYAAWGDVYRRTRDMLIPFESFEGMVTHVTSAAELARVLGGDRADLARPTQRGMSVAFEHLGPVDGRASERALEVVRAHVSAGRPPMTGVAGTSVAAAAIRGVGAVVAGGAARIPRVGATSIGGALDRRALEWRQELQELQAIRRRRSARSPTRA
jgi:CDP-glycerol glycerophosphotransferase (TagB/SpsB family)